jgi:hypothetical protein
VCATKSQHFITDEEKRFQKIKASNIRQQNRGSFQQADNIDGRIRFRTNENLEIEARNSHTTSNCATVWCALVHREKALTWIDMCSLLSGKRRLFFARAPSPVTGNLLLSRRRRRRVTQNGPMKDEGAHCLRLCRFIESQAHARKAISASEKWLFSLWQSENERAIYGY